MSGTLRRLAVLCCAIACVLALGGCTMPQQQPAEHTDKVAENRQYMSALNQMSVDLSERLAGFTDAVSRNDTVGMRTQADDAFQIISKMKEQEAPEDLTELKDGYMQACEGLEEALGSYIALYDDVASSTTPINSDAYAEQLEKIQKRYDEAIDLLASTDQKATELQR